MKPDSENGLILEVDWYVPQDKHDTFKNYPVGPEKKMLMVSCYQNIKKIF